MQNEVLPSGIVIAEDRGYVDITAELFVQLCKHRESPRPFTSIAVIEDALPEGATVHSIGKADMHDTVRVYLNGVENRQYCPKLEERYPPSGPDIWVDGVNRRAKVAKALRDLWYAMGVEWDTRIPVPNNKQKTQRDYWASIGKTLLGDDAPDMEIYRG